MVYNKNINLVFVAIIIFLVAGCAKKPVVKPEPVPEPVAIVPSVEVSTPVPVSTEQEPEDSLMVEEPTLRDKEYLPVPELKPIYFGYDDDKLNKSERSSLSQNAEWLKNNPDMEIVIEGHCDERGTVEYNLALGDRRAKAVRKYLMYLGISGSRIATISYGEEKPVEFGHDETAWSKNRRAEILARQTQE